MSHSEPCTLTCQPTPNAPVQGPFKVICAPSTRVSHLLVRYADIIAGNCAHPWFGVTPDLNWFHSFCG